MTTNNREGWICPRCKASNSPDVEICKSCTVSLPRNHYQMNRSYPGHPAPTEWGPAEQRMEWTSRQILNEG